MEVWVDIHGRINLSSESELEEHYLRGLRGHLRVDTYGKQQLGRDDSRYLITICKAEPPDISGLKFCQTAEGDTAVVGIIKKDGVR